MGPFVTLILTIIALTGVTALVKGIRVVPQNETWIIERLGKYSRPLVGGLNLLVPFVDRVAYKWDMREQAMSVPQQDATTKDNIRVAIDGVLYIQITDARRASYGSTNPYNSVVELAQTTMRAQIGRMELDQTLSKRDEINGAVVAEVNEAASPWGVLIKRYEINDIVPPRDMQEDMKRQAKAERERRELETSAVADRAARITRAEGKKKEAELLSEGDRIKVENEARAKAMAVEAAAQADATARRLRADAEADALMAVGKAATTKEGHTAVTFHLAQEAIAAQAKIAGESTIVLKDGANGAGQSANTVAEAMAVAALIGQ